MADNPVLEMSLEELINKMGSSQTTVFPSQLQTAALRIISNRLIESMDKNAKSSANLSRVLVWLNVLIAFATVVGVWIAARGIIGGQ